MEQSSRPAWHAPMSCSRLGWPYALEHHLPESAIRFTRKFYKRWRLEWMLLPMSPEFVRFFGIFALLRMMLLLSAVYLRFIE